MPIFVIAAILVALRLVAGDVGCSCAARADRPRCFVGAQVRRPYLPALPYGRSSAACSSSSRCPARHLRDLIPQQSRYSSTRRSSILTYVMLGWGLNIVVGLAGLLDLGYVAFYAVGAYSFALLAHYFELALLDLPAARRPPRRDSGGSSSAFPVLRLRGDYLAIVTLAFGEIIRLVLINWDDFTGGPNGITNIPRPTLLRHPLQPRRRRLRRRLRPRLLAGPPHHLALLHHPRPRADHQLRHRCGCGGFPIGRAWEALREDEIACRSLGINTTNTKLTAFAMGAMFGGFAGSFFATRQGFISPESFNFTRVVDRSSPIVVLGGLGSQLGVVIARSYHWRPRTRDCFEASSASFDPAIPHADLRPVDGADHGVAAARPDLDAAALGHSFASGRRSPPNSSARATDERAGRPTRSSHVEHLTMRFGGLVAINDLSFAVGPRRDHRADRPERRRQDHRLQLHHRLLQADRGADRDGARAAAPSRELDRGHRQRPGDRRRLSSSCSSACPTTRSPSAPGSRAPSRTSGSSAA